jgi:hypothetical protein
VNYSERGWTQHQVLQRCIEGKKGVLNRQQTRMPRAVEGTRKLDGDFEPLVEKTASSGFSFSRI